MSGNKISLFSEEVTLSVEGLWPAASDWSSGEDRCNFISQDHSHNKHKTPGQIPSACYVMTDSMLSNEERESEAFNK